MEFEVYNCNEKGNKKFESIINANTDDTQKENKQSLKNVVKEDGKDDLSKTTTWYHATDIFNAIEIMRNGIRVCIFCSLDVILLA